MDKKSSNILNKILDYKSWTFKLNWSSGVVLVTAITGCLYFYNENKSLRSKVEKIPVLEETIRNQGSAINALESSTDVFNNIIQSFMNNPPSGLKRDIDDIRHDMDKYHNNPQPTIVYPPDTAIVRNAPPSL